MSDKIVMPDIDVKRLVREMCAISPCTVGGDVVDCDNCAFDSEESYTKYITQQEEENE